MTEIRESRVEAYLVREVKRLGGRCPKWVSPMESGVPDRIALIPCLRAWFIETKRPGKRLEGLQIDWNVYLNDHGFNTACLDTIGAVAGWIAQREKELHALGA